MTYKVPPLQCLIAFEAVARLRSGTVAAQELCVTPSAISHRIRQLEDIMGIEVFNSAQGGFTLTARGSEYLEVVKEALNALSHYSVRPRSAGEIRQLRVAAPPTFARQVLVPHLTGFQEAHPEIELILQLSVPLVGLKSENADIEIRFGTGNYPGLETLKILDEPVFPVCSPSYLRDVGPFPSPDRLSVARLLRCPLEPWRPWLVAAGLDWPEPGVGVQFVDLGLMLEAAVNGQGVALARNRMARSWISSGVLVPLFDIQVHSIYAYYITYPPGCEEGSDIATFVRWMAEILRNPLK
ncbi:LysR substrate-binding domain-containing protein [Cupriavidus basilensis]|uniref:LysR substrate-binding domain-containing protein n=1 Tax=Cupriavidus basilensis TaxID=68895 RepID=A0ABT6B374_9BURK|nr:LysR substrate-binding domain-containing protein [Cupriavidus basilensis]MDF3839315.1 LysR substrate-binding domain-containing protein [Cupriavidus basilensis]